MNQPASRHVLGLSRSAYLYEAVSTGIDGRELTREISEGSSSSDALESHASHVENGAGNTKEAKAQQQHEPDLSWYSRVKLQLHHGELQGWRFGIFLSTLMTTAVLLINVFITLWASLRYGLEDGIGTAYTGEYRVVNAWSVGLHVLVNALSSAVFGASNYTMQCLMAPTRDECDRAHLRRDWLDIGVPSFRNLVRISWKRKLAWVLLSLSSVPVHFIYNSVVFKTMESVQSAQFIPATAGILRAEEIDFDVIPKQVPIALEGTKIEYFDLQIVLDSWNEKKPNVTHLRQIYLSDRMKFDRLEPQQCIDIYGADFLTGHSHVFIIVDPTVKVNKSDQTSASWKSKITSWTVLGLSEAEAEATPMYWPGYKSDIIKYTERDSRSQAWLFQGMYLEYCMAKREEPHCKLQFSMYLLVVVIVCNVIKVTVMIWHLSQQHTETFVTFGDALASWLDEADENTRGDCLIDKSCVRTRKKKCAGQLGALPQSGVMARRRQSAPPLLGLITRKATEKRRWFAAVNTKQGLISLMLCITSLCAAAILLGLTHRDPTEVTVRQAIAAGRFFANDKASTIGTLLPTKGSAGLVASILLVNTPQMILSCCYMAYNGLFTGMHLSHEYSSYAVDRKSLRVTQPRGEQRSTYWLQLPFRYSLPLLIATTVLHWLISQSMFLVRFERYNADFETQTLLPVSSSTADGSGVGISVLPVLTGIILAACMLLTLVGLGFRRLPSNMPIAGSCSFALAAATHRPSEDNDASMLPLMWGEIPRMGTQDLGHCAFTSEEVVELKSGREYA